MDFDQDDDELEIDTGIPDCPHCRAADVSTRLTFNAGAARSPHVSRQRWKCRHCGSIFDVTSAPGHASSAQVIRPGRIP